MAVIDGRAEIIEEVRAAKSDVRTYLAGDFDSMLAKRAFIDALPGFLLPDSTSQTRQSMLLDRVRALANLG